jgi:UDP-hydrolysing UDP-N-acetyl-D-glucosamine 2-epimerase
MSHVHFASTDLYARRIVQMGESPERVEVSGAPALDNLVNFQPLTHAQLCTQERLTLPPRFLLVVYHPITFEHENTPQQMEELLAAVASAGLPALISYPNTDTSSRTIIAMLRDFVAHNPQHQLVTNLDAQAYYSAMSLASAMVGNSSSGIIEAASFGLPVVNIGPRQQGRLRPRNVLDAPCQREPIQAAMRKALSPEFRKELSGMKNPYGDGHAAERIMAALKNLPPVRTLLVKRFHEATEATANH